MTWPPAGQSGYHPDSAGDELAPNPAQPHAGGYDLNGGYYQSRGVRHPGFDPTRPYGDAAAPKQINQVSIIASILAALLVIGAGVGAYLYFSKDAATTSTTAAPPAPANLPEDIEEITVFDYPPGQEHLMAEAYAESPPVGGPHDATWADCDGAVYDQQVRSENAVHSLEHGAVWITYDVDAVVAEEISVLAAYVRNQPYMLMSPYDGLSSPISVQSWNHQLFVDSVDDPRISSFIQLLRQNPDEYPEVGATCSQPAFLADPVLEGEQSRLPGDG